MNTKIKSYILYKVSEEKDQLLKASIYRALAIQENNKKNQEQMNRLAENIENCLKESKQLLFKFKSEN